MQPDDIKEKFKSGAIRDGELEQVLFRDVFGSDPSRLNEVGRLGEKIRAEILEERTGVRLERVQACRMDTVRLQQETLTTGIEMKVGGVVIPLGVAGPIQVKGVAARGEYHIACATNEAALMAGLQRGIKAINRAGGVRTMVTRDSMSRAPLLEAPDIFEGRRLIEDLQAGLGERLKSIPSDEGPFLRLDRIEPFQLNNKVWVRFVCKTGDAMGMNGVTKHAAKLVKAIIEAYPKFRLIALSGNLCVDKKASALNVLHGRGKTVETEVVVSRELLHDIFAGEATPEAVSRINQWKNLYGSALSATVTGFNANVANTVAAIFAATGQDLAQVVESSTCFDHADATDEGLRFGVTLPCLEVATIGGGTAFGTARECLELMGCGGWGRDADDNENVRRLAELIGAAVTAQELNLLCTLASTYELASSHVKLARGEEE